MYNVVVFVHYISSHRVYTLMCCVNLASASMPVTTKVFTHLVCVFVSSLQNMCTFTHNGYILGECTIVGKRE